MAAKMAVDGYAFDSEESDITFQDARESMNDTSDEAPASPTQSSTPRISAIAFGESRPTAAPFHFRYKEVGQEIPNQPKALRGKREGVTDDPESSVSFIIAFNSNEHMLI